MVYVLDSSFVIQLHKHYYRETFVSLWQRFDEMLAAGRFTSTREVKRELQDSDDAAAEWAEANRDLFVTPNVQANRRAAPMRTSKKHMPARPVERGVGRQVSTAYPPHRQ